MSDLYGRKPLFVACLSLFTLCMAATAVAPSRFVFGTFRLVAASGFGSVSSSLILTGYLAQCPSPRVRAGGTGWALSFARIGAFCGPLLGGTVASLGVDPD